MPTDVRELLEGGAPTPLRDVDVGAVSARGRQWRRRRNTGAAAALAAVVALAVLPMTRLLSPSPTVVLEGTADAPQSALAYGVDGDIYVAEPNGANPVRIADGEPRWDGDCRPGEQRNRYLAFGSPWSPDGRYLAYWNWRPCDPSRTTSGPDTSQPPPPDEWGTVIISDPQGKVLASFPGQGWLISWSPDSTHVAIFDTLGWGGDETPPQDAIIGVYGVDGERQAALTLPTSLKPSGDISPMWSRDGTSLLVSDVQVPLDGRAPRRLRDHNFDSVYSPDGSRVAYIDHREPYGLGPLVVTEADGSEARQVFGWGEYPESAWSPSGDRVAFIHVLPSGEVDSDGLLASPSELRVRDVTTGAETSLVHVNASERLQIIEFSADGERIFFWRTDDYDGVGSLWSINADGSEARRLVPRAEWADWRPPTPTR